MIRTLSFILLLFISTITSAEPIKVMSYNILSERWLSCGNYDKLPYNIINTEIRIKKISEIITNENPDIIALQEVEQSPMEYLKTHLDKKYIYVNHAPPENNKDFFVILYNREKFKFNESRIFCYPNSSKYYQAINLTDKNQNHFWVINTKAKWDEPHKPYNEHIGSLQIQALIKNITENNITNAIICGDFNLPPQHSYLRPITRLFTDIHLNANYPTVNINNKLQRIDYIFCNKKYNGKAIIKQKIKKNTIIPSLEIPSDHLPIIAYLEIENSNE